MCVLVRLEAGSSLYLAGVRRCIGMNGTHRFVSLASTFNNSKRKYRGMGRFRSVGKKIVRSQGKFLESFYRGVSGLLDPSHLYRMWKTLKTFYAFEASFQLANTSFAKLQIYPFKVLITNGFATDRKAFGKSEDIIIFDIFCFLQYRFV